MKNKLPAKLSNGLYYSDDEISALYRDAADKRYEIKVLAELNACTKEEIIQHLIRIGIDKRSLPRANKAEKAAGEKKHYNIVSNKPKKPRTPRKKKETVETVVETHSEVVTESEYPVDSAGYKNATLVGCILRSQAEAEERYNVNLAATDHTIATNETIEVYQNTEVRASNSLLDMINSILEKMKLQKRDLEAQSRGLTLQLEKINDDLKGLDMSIEAVERTISVIANMTKN